MAALRIPSGILFLLALIFTIGLTFASLELPHLVDQALIERTPTPGIQSRTDQINHLQSELFLSHYHLRTVGYLGFVLTVGLIVAGYATRKPGLAAWGAGVIMLNVFAQFAAVMFFLAGLGLLNVLWLPVLDGSFHIPDLGRIILLPYRLWRAVPGPLGDVDTKWIAGAVSGAGLLVFLLGTFAWLSVRREGPAAARPALESARGDPDRDVRLYAAETLKRLPKSGLEESP